MSNALRSIDPSTAALVVLGVPISRASISLSRAWATPAAFREALQRFPAWDASTGTDIGLLPIADTGDVIGDRYDHRISAAHQRIEEAVADLATHTSAVLAVIGGDNSLTRPAMLGMMRGRPAEGWGLLTLDAHHDCRSPEGGSRNGTPVRELIEGGLDGARVAQVGIHPLANAREHAEWARDHGIHVHHVDEVRRIGVDAVIGEALAELAASGVDTIYADLDLDVVDRAFAPACPASMPGGLMPADLIDAARRLGCDPAVAAVDLCEVDALADNAGITVRLMAAAFTAFAGGVTRRMGVG